MMRKVVTDGVVNFENAGPWVEALYREKPPVVIKRAMDVEPAIMSAVATAAKRTAELLEEHGATEQMQCFVLGQMCFAGALAVELMRQGNRILFDGLIEDPTNQKGKSHE